MDQKDFEMIRAVLKEELMPLKTSVEERLSSVGERLTVVEGGVRSLKKEVRDVKLTLENETNRNIRIIAEGHLDLNRKLDEALQVENEKEILLIRVNILENKLRKIKESVEAIA